MGKKYFLITVLAALIILVGCNNDIKANIRGIELDHIKTPDRLEIWSPDINKKNQELGALGLEISDLMNNSANLSDEERKELEEKINYYTLKVDEFHEQIINIDNQEVIEDIFNKIRESRGIYDRYLTEDLLRSFDYYSAQLFYEGVDMQTKNLEDGYIFSLFIFDDNTLVFFDKVYDGGLEPREIIVQFNYKWFSNQVE